MAPDQRPWLARLEWFERCTEGYPVKWHQFRRSFCPRPFEQKYRQLFQLLEGGATRSAQGAGGGLGGLAARRVRRDALCPDPHGDHPGPRFEPRNRWSARIT